MASRLMLVQLSNVCNFLPSFRAEALMTDQDAQTTLVPLLMDRFVLSRKSNKLGSSEGLVARPEFMAMCSL
jgi:hypothetical protein